MTIHSETKLLQIGLSADNIAIRTVIPDARNRILSSVKIWADARMQQAFMQPSVTSSRYRIGTVATFVLTMWPASVMSVPLESFQQVAELAQGQAIVGATLPGTTNNRLSDWT
jgi:hypothetical protein